MHETPYLSRRPRTSFLQSFSSNKLLLPQKRQDHQKEGTLLVGRQIQERSTIILSFQQNLHASYLLADYQHHYQWYVYLFLLKSSPYYLSRLVIFQGHLARHFCMHILFIFPTLFEYLNNKYITKVQQNINWDIIMWSISFCTFSLQWGFSLQDLFFTGFAPSFS